MIRKFLAVETALFLLASFVHRGYFLGGYEHGKAAIAETVIGVVLLAGLLATLAWPARARGIGIGVQAFALLGTFVGLFTIAVGVGPQSQADLVFHVLLVLLLGAGLLAAARTSA